MNKVTFPALSLVESKTSRAFRDSYIQTIFDPVQTHALYGIHVNDIDEAKRILKDLAAARFRVIKKRFGFAIICFKLKSA